MKARLREYFWWLTWWERCEWCERRWPGLLMQAGEFTPDTHFTAEHQEWECPICRKVWRR